MALAERTEREGARGARAAAGALPASRSGLAMALGRVRARLRLSACGRIVAALLVLTFVKQLVLVAAYPPFQGHDEVGHYGYLWTMEHFGRLPTLNDNLPVILGQYDIYTLDWPALYTANHPPLYYLLTYPIMRLAGTDAPGDLFLRLYALRLASIVPFLVTIWLTYRLARTLFPRDRFLALTAPAAVAFGPQLSFEGAIVNNDMLSICWGTLILYLCAHAIRRGLTLPRALALGVALGLGLLIKATLTVFLPLAGLVALYCRWPRPWGRVCERAYWRGTLAAALAMVVPAVAIPAPWYAFMKRTYGDFSAFGAIQALQQGWNVPAGTFGELLTSRAFHLERIHESFGYWGWKLIPLTGPQLRLVYAGLLLCAVGLLVGAVRLGLAWRARGIRPETEQIAGVALLAAAFGAMYAATIYFGTMFLLTQARYFFPAAAAAAILAMLGIRALVPPRLVRPAAALTIAALAAFNLWLLVGSILPYAFL
jgi:4-amino-4-deoxy-L-arabinose transferase-like glycosyltransferase